MIPLILLCLALGMEWLIVIAAYRGADAKDSIVAFPFVLLLAAAVAKYIGF